MGYRFKVGSKRDTGHSNGALPPLAPAEERPYKFIRQPRFALIHLALQTIANHRQPHSSYSKKTSAPSGASLLSIQLRNAGQITRLADHRLITSGAVPLRPVLPLRGFAFGGFLEAEGGDLVGVVAELGADLVLDALDAFVAFFFEDDCVVAGGGVGVGGVEFAFAGSAYAGLEIGDGGEGVGGVAGVVALDGLECGDAVEVGLQDVGGKATVGVVGHDSSGGGGVG